MKKLFSGSAEQNQNTTKMSGIFVVCSYNYEKEDEDELTIAVGEKLELVDEVDDNGWVTGRNAKGESGLIPIDF